MRTVIRFLLTVLVFPILYPILIFTYSFFSLAIWIGLVVSFGDLVFYLIGDPANKDWHKSELIYHFSLVSDPFVLPLLEFKKFILTGNFNIG